MVLRVASALNCERWLIHWHDFELRVSTLEAALSSSIVIMLSRDSHTW